jgi:hypothetical protein
MKSSVAIAMIVCGTILIALPHISSAISMHEVAKTMIALDKPVNLSSNFPKHTSSVCLLGGIAMIVVGATSGYFSKYQK